MVADPVGEVAAGELHEGADPVVDAVQRPEAEGAQAQTGDQVQGQDGGDHLGGDVGDHADRAQGEDGRGDGGPPDGSPVRSGLRALGRGRGAVREVHALELPVPTD